MSNVALGAQLERPRYFSGQRLTVEDLRAEQDYHLRKQRRHNIMFHGWGIVFGLDVSVNLPGEGSGTEVHVSPGLALDCEGNEIVVGQCASLMITNPIHPDLPSTATAPTWDGAVTLWLAIRYKEFPTRAVPVPDGEDTNEYSRTVEGFELQTLTTLPDSHRLEYSETCQYPQEDGESTNADTAWIVLAMVTIQSLPSGLAVLGTSPLGRRPIRPPSGSRPSSL